MRRLGDCRVAVCSHTLRQVLVEARLPGRRTGAIMIVDQDGQLRGIFTDSDLARLFESRRDSLLDDPIRNVMTKNPTAVPQGSMMFDAVAIMAERRISELPVVDADSAAGGHAGYYRHHGTISGKCGCAPERRRRRAACRGRKIRRCCKRPAADVRMQLELQSAKPHAD